ncbi:MAG: hypothetical protein EAZ92_04130 [Candidatus Kapaibacterium sp.]|nr:MAG: hypothetical protein EAZ92_04130 [Candidatus Kapabacteria bacterium]
MRSNKFIVYLNYAARGMVGLVGVLWVSGLVPMVNGDVNVRMFGIVIILFGVYRVAMYWNQRQQEARYEE